jgi:hypothetical protein
MNELEAFVTWKRKYFAQNSLRHGYEGLLRKGRQEKRHCAENEENEK